jgi:UDP-glucuronate 4-epimerase
MAAQARKVLVTGGAGFIGSHLVDSLLAQGDRVWVIDNFNDYYDPRVKRFNVREHLKHSAYNLFEGDIRNDDDLDQVFAQGPFDVVVHLAAMAGVRPSLQQPAYYMDVNVNGTQKLVDRIARNADKTRLVFGSSSSVYGERSGERFKETDRVDHPLSPYAATKAANELQLYAAYHTTGLKVACLRFFTVFGPRQRPDLAIHKFCHLINENKPIELYGDGTTFRDYTFVKDIVAGIEAAMSYVWQPDFSGYDIFNLGRCQPVKLIEMVEALEKHLKKNAVITYKPMQIGDVPYTFASIEHAQAVLKYQPQTSFDEGVGHFVRWFLESQVTA